MPPPPLPAGLEPEPEPEPSGLLPFGPLAIEGLAINEDGSGEEQEQTGSGRRPRMATQGKRRGTIKVEEFDNSDMQLALLAASARGDFTPNSSPMARDGEGREHSNAFDAAAAARGLVSAADGAGPAGSVGAPEVGGIADSSGGAAAAGEEGEPVGTITPSVQQALTTLEKCGLQRLREVFLSEHIAYENLGLLVEDTARMEALGMRIGEQIRLRAAIKFHKRPQRPQRRNSFDEWLDDGVARHVDDLTQVCAGEGKSPLTAVP
jgi:hypothetical protein